MPPVKDMSRITDKWKRMAAAAQEDYRQGVENPRADWATSTANAEGTYYKYMKAWLAGRRGK